MYKSLLFRKRPRDLVHLDEFWPADENWPSYYLSSLVWIYFDEYGAELIGDEDYCRIIINSGNDSGWVYRRPIAERYDVLSKLEAVKIPISEDQLFSLGFIRWCNEDIY